MSGHGPISIPYVMLQLHEFPRKPLSPPAYEYPSSARYTCLLFLLSSRSNFPQSRRRVKVKERTVLGCSGRPSWADERQSVMHHYTTTTSSKQQQLGFLKLPKFSLSLSFPKLLTGPPPDHHRSPTFALVRMKERRER